MIDKEKLDDLMRESRVVGAADNVLFPMIKLKIENRVSLACSKFAGGEKDFVADIAYIHAFKEIEQELRKKITAGNQANFDLNKSQL